MSETESTGWISCPECEAECRDRTLAPGASLECGRCGVVVKKHHDPRALQRAWAICTAGLVFFVLANIEPIMVFDVSGNTQSNHIITGVTKLVQQNYSTVALLVFFGAIAAPALHLAAAWYVLSGCCLGCRWPFVEKITKACELLSPWNLVPVYAVAIVVAVVKLDMLGSIEWKQGAFWIVALSLSSLITQQLFDRRQVEERLHSLRS